MFWLTLIILIFFSAFFSGSEAGLTSLSDYRLRKIYNKYKLFHNPIKLWIYKPYRIIITILIGNTIVNLLISSLSTRYVLSLNIPIPKEVKEFLIWLIVTFIIIIFGELTPKILSKNFPERISKLALLPIYIFQHIVLTIFLPIFYIMERYLKKEPVSYFTKIDEIKRIISESSKAIFQKDINEIFFRATKFYETRVRDIMTPKDKVEMVNISGKSLSTIIDEIIETGKTRVPLYDGSLDKIIGFALVKDLFYLCSIGTECSISDIIHPILEVNLNTKVIDLFKEFKNSQIHIAKVVDENKKFCGIVTLEDVIEEIVGDILDEYDVRVSS